MAPTFYGVLGVGPDADADAIEMGYRERVTDVHPDVNDDPDADAQFRRLTTAKETLLDADERARYDRLGHAPYVRHHISCAAWESTVPGTDDTVSSGPEDVDGSGADERDDSRSNGSRDRESRRSRQSGGRRRHVDQGPARDSGSGVGNTDERSGGSAGAAGQESRRGRGSGDGQGTSRGGSGGRTRADAAGNTTYATSSFWDSQRVGKRYGTTNASRESPLVRLFNGVRALGPWLVVHLVFLGAAVGMSWYVYVVLLDADAVSPLLLVVLVGEIALAATLSAIHVLTRIYR